MPVLLDLPSDLLTRIAQHGDIRDLCCLRQASPVYLGRLLRTTELWSHCVSRTQGLIDCRWGSGAPWPLRELYPEIGTLDGFGPCCLTRAPAYARDFNSACVAVSSHTCARPG